MCRDFDESSYAAFGTIYTSKLYKKRRLCKLLRFGTRVAVVSPSSYDEMYLPTMRYAHTNLIAKNWRELARFYQDVFDCVVVPPQREQCGHWLERATGVKGAALRGVHLRLPGHGENGSTLEIFQYDEVLERPEPLANRQGLARKITSRRALAHPLNLAVHFVVAQIRHVFRAPPKCTAESN